MNKNKTTGLRFLDAIFTLAFFRPWHFVSKAVAVGMLTTWLTACATNPERVSELEPAKVGMVAEEQEKAPENGSEQQKTVEDKLGQLIQAGSNAYNHADYRKAIHFWEQGLTKARSAKQQQWVGNFLTNLGVAYSALGQVARAIDFYQQALAIRREIGDHRGEGIDLLNLGVAHYALGQVPRAIDYYQQALAIQSQVGAPDSLWRIWANLRVAHNKLNQPTPAIFFGKQAVNVIQTLRAHIATLEKDLQKSFLKDKEPVYRNLADLLIEQSRLPEAEQVLAMLKEEEYFDFIRRDSNEDDRTTQASYTPIEQEWKQRYDEITEQLVKLGAEYDLLVEKNQRSAAEEECFKALQADMDVAREAFLTTLDELDKAFSNLSAEQAKAYAAKNLEFLENEQETLANLQHGAVLIHTVLTEDTLHLLLTTPNTQIARKTSISAADLNQKIRDFRIALKSPQQNPQPLAQELYRLLVKPIQADLDQAKAHTLMWSLDGLLRYIPMAALYDGQHYLIERYALALYTAAARGNLAKRPTAQWKVAGLGTSQAYEGFDQLDSVPGELDGIVRLNVKDQNGVLPGVIHLNDEFTDDRFKVLLGQRYPVFHIASHFKLQPGNNAASYLLLGDGNKLTLSAFKKGSAYKFRGVDLLTLSACNTAVGSRGQGQEVEGFAVLAQKRGAKGVLATLWPVDDKSTGLLMQNLYRIRTANPDISKADALRQAQIAFLEKEGLPSEQQPSQSTDPNRGAIDPDDPNPNTSSTTDYTHPYYWAPFILMGNWL